MLDQSDLTLTDFLGIEDRAHGGSKLDSQRSSRHQNA
jgi:hypothetical protein